MVTIGIICLVLIVLGWTLMITSRKHSLGAAGGWVFLVGYFAAAIAGMAMWLGN